MLLAIVVAGTAALDATASETGTTPPTTVGFAAPGSFEVLLVTFAIVVAVIADDICEAIGGGILASGAATTGALVITFPEATDSAVAGDRLGTEKGGGEFVPPPRCRPEASRL